MFANNIFVKGMFILHNVDDKIHFVGNCCYICGAGNTCK